MQGIFDMIGVFFRADKDGNSPVKGMLTGLMNAMSAIGKSPQAEASK